MVCLPCHFNTDPDVVCLDCDPTQEELCKRCERNVRYMIRLMNGEFKLSQLCYWCLKASITLHTLWA